MTDVKKAAESVVARLREGEAQRHLEDAARATRRRMQDERRKIEGCWRRQLASLVYFVRFRRFF